MPDRMPHVLVVEDEPDVRNTLVRILDSGGYRAIQASCGEEALIRLQERAFDLVLLDLYLPGIEGLEVLAWGVDQGSSPFIALSGRADAEMVVKALASGALDFITKPVRAAELLTVVGAHASAARDPVAGRVGRCLDEPQVRQRLAYFFGLCPTTVDAHVRKATGMSCAQYVRQLHTAKARRILEVTDMDVKQIAYRLGFKSADAFRKVFTRSTGESPTTYRLRAREHPALP